jgi:hypothetical protein
MRWPLSAEIPKYEVLRQRILADYPNLDEETLADTLEGITDLHEMIAAIIRSALVDEALQAGLRTRLDEMRARLGRLAERGLKKRLNEVGLKKLVQPDFTASSRSGFPGLVVTSEQAIPSDYWVVRNLGAKRRDSTSLASALSGVRRSQRKRRNSARFLPKGLR